MANTIYIDLETEETSIWDKLNGSNSFQTTIKQLIEIGTCIWTRGWAEGSSGNVSVRLDPETCSVISEFVVKSKSKSKHDEVRYTKVGQWYLVSVSGSRFRDYTIKGLNNFTLVGTYDNQKDNDPADYFNIPFMRKPTSEWKAHALMHKCLQTSNSPKKVILHVHDTEWMILSTLPMYETEKEMIINDINHLLPELKYYMKQGIVLLPFREPGSYELAKMSENAICKSDCLVWERHGVIVAADNVETAYDYLELLNKAAVIYLNRRKLLP